MKDNIFKEGDIVYAVERPSIRLKVRRYITEIYYCTVADDPMHRELVYFERELMPPVVKPPGETE